MHRQVTRTLRRDKDPLARGAKSLPRKYFVAPKIFADEQKRIFAQEWLLVGHQSQIPSAGDYIVQEVSAPPSPQGSGVTLESLIIIRDKSREIHGFFNVCRHR